MNDWNNIESSNIDGYDNGFEWLYDYQQRIVNQDLNDEMFMGKFTAHPESGSSFSNVNSAISMLPLGPLPPVATNVSNSIYPLNTHTSSATPFSIASSFFNSDVSTNSNSNNHSNNNGNGNLNSNNYDICTSGEEKNLLELGKEKSNDATHDPSIQANYNFDRDLNRNVCTCLPYSCNESMMSKNVITSQAQNKIKDYYTNQATGCSTPKINETKNVQPLDLSQRPMVANYFLYSNGSTFTYPNSSFIASSSPNVKSFGDLKVLTHPIQGQRAIQSKSEIRFNSNNSSTHQPVPNLGQCCNYRLIQGSRDVIVVPSNYTRFINFGSNIQPIAMSARLNTNQMGANNCQFATIMPTKIVNKYELNANDQNGINQENYFTSGYSNNVIPNGVFKINLNNEKHIEYNMAPNYGVPISPFNEKVILPTVQVPLTRKRGRGRAKSSCNNSSTLR